MNQISHQPEKKFVTSHRTREVNRSHKTTEDEEEEEEEEELEDNIKKKAQNLIKPIQNLNQKQKK